MAQHLEIVLFDEAIRKVQAYLKPVGLQIDYRDRYRTLRERLRLWSSIDIIWMTTAVLGQITWLVQSAYTGKSFVELTSIGPCFALCTLSNIQAFYFIKNGPQICELIETIRMFQSTFAQDDLDDDDVIFLKNQMKILYIAINSITVIIVLGITGFGISPLVNIVESYYSTGEVKLSQPFIVAYPFDDTDIRFWPFVYIHQMWAAVVAVLTVLSPGFLCYACSTFIIFQFRVLHNDFEKVIPFKTTLDIRVLDEEFRRKWMNIIDRHRKLIACVDLMELVYSEPTLFNVVTSTLHICLTGFNVTIIKDLTLVVPFLQFLLMSFVHTYCLCYYGDMIMFYSMRVADAAYNCQWYRADKSILKDLMIICARARKPCKLTAFKYSDVNFKTFTRILSSSWSYFALLTSLYRE